MTTLVIIQGLVYATVPTAITLVLFEWIQPGMIFDFVGKWRDRVCGESNEYGVVTPKRKVFTPLFCPVCASFYVSLAVSPVLPYLYDTVWDVFIYIIFTQFLTWKLAQ